jgi:hypothetical protein
MFALLWQWSPGICQARERESVTLSR